MSLGKYIKAAFKNRWNLLFFLGGIAFAAISGAVDVVGPLVLAAEIGYLGLLGIHPKFQQYVDSQEALSARNATHINVEESLRGIVRSLPTELMKRFETLRDRCVQLRQIAMDLKYPNRSGAPLSLEREQLTGLDRLLWIYLKLLFTVYSLERFFKTTTEHEIVEEIRRTEARINEAKETPESIQREKLLRTLEDNLHTCQSRLDNYHKAANNYELVQLEVNRLENKIRSLSELAVNRQEPEFISSQVDEVASSMLDTEKTINELQFVTGLQSSPDHVPELLQRNRVRTK